MADVTIAGTGGSTVNISFGSGANAQAAQAALANVAKFIADGTDAVVGISSVGALPPPNPNATATVGIVGDFGAGSVFEGVIPTGYSTLINTNTGLTMLTGSQDTTLVESGSSSEFLFANNASNAQVFLGGGNNEISNGSANASMTVNLSGPSAPGAAAAAAIVDGALGSTTVNVANGSLLNVRQGAVNVVAQAGIETVEVSAPTNVATSVVTVSGVAGSTVFYVPGGGDAFLNPGAGNIVVFNSGLGGSETLFGGAATIGGNAVTANAFTGSATVLGGNGYFQGGSAGNNILQTSTLSGTATLVGGGNGDHLTAFGRGDLLIAGAGNETLSGQGFGGNTFVTSNDSTSADFISGDSHGNDTVLLGLGSATIALQHSINPPPAIANSLNLISSGNTIMEQASIHGGNFTITDFLPSAAGGISDVVSLNAGVSVSAFASVGGNTTATLSDGTTITFAGVSGQGSNTITNHGSFLT